VPFPSGTKHNKAPRTNERPHVLSQDLKPRGESGFKKDFLTPALGDSATSIKPRHFGLHYLCVSVCVCVCVGGGGVVFVTVANFALMPL